MFIQATDKWSLFRCSVLGSCFYRDTPHFLLSKREREFKKRVDTLRMFIIDHINQIK